MYILALPGSFSSPFISASARFIVRKSATRRKKCELCRKSPREKKKNGELFGKSCAPAHTARLPPLRNSPSTAPPLPAFSGPIRTSARSLRTTTCRCGRCLGHVVRCHAKCSCRSRAEGRSFGIARPKARRHPVHRRQPRKNAVHDREAVRKMTYRKNARTRKSIRTAETAAQTLHGFLRNAEGRAGKD